MAVYPLICFYHRFSANLHLAHNIRYVLASLQVVPSLRRSIMLRTFNLVQQLLGHVSVDSHRSFPLTPFPCSTM